jgi:hypothetical protein
LSGVLKVSTQKARYCRMVGSAMRSPPRLQAGGGLVSAEIQQMTL